VKGNDKDNTLSSKKRNEFKNEEDFKELGGYGGYYGYCNSPNLFGIRRRSGEMTYSKNLDQPYNSGIIDMEADINFLTEKSTKTRQIKRPLSKLSTVRLVSAEAAERSLSELTKLFSNMSTLIVSQGEILTRIEDDIEMTIGEIETGSSEISKLYTSTKSNRQLILRVFGIMTFLIIFMRIYY